MSSISRSATYSEASGLKVIPVNEFFDSMLGDHVSKDNLHSQLLLNYFDGDPSNLRQTGRREHLAAASSEEVTGKAGR